LIIQTVNGVVTGMILALIASGLTLIFGIMEVVRTCPKITFTIDK
jgi:branched-subunit amino acid ABC-type transport system permease component